MTATAALPTSVTVPAGHPVHISAETAAAV